MDDVSGMIIIIKYRTFTIKNKHQFTLQYSNRFDFIHSFLSHILLAADKCTVRNDLHTVIHCAL